jgi:transposase InsO family protein
VAQPVPTDGRRRMAAQVGRAPYRLLVTRQRAQPVMRHRGLLRRTRPRQPRTTHSRQGLRRVPNGVADRAAREPDESWVSDRTYGRLGAECISLALSMEVLPRASRGWQLGRTLGQALTVTARQRALAPRTPSMPHSDQGLQDAAPRSSPTWPAAGGQSSMAAVGNPRQNGDAERVSRTSTAEESNLTEYRDFPAALAQIGQFIADVSRTTRIPSARGSLTPVEVEAAWRREHGNEGSPRKPREQLSIFWGPLQ